MRWLLLPLACSCASSETLGLRRYHAAVHEARAGKIDDALLLLDDRFGSHNSSSMTGSWPAAAARLRARLQLLVGQFRDAADAYQHQRLSMRRDLALRLEKQRRRVLSLFRSAEYADAADEASRVLRHARMAPWLYRLRGECHLQLRGDVQAAHNDASVAVTLAPHEPRGLLLASRALYASFGADDPLAMRSVRRCVRVAPDDAACAAFARWLRHVAHRLASARRLEAAGALAEAGATFVSVVRLHIADASAPLTDDDGGHGVAADASGGGGDGGDGGGRGGAAAAAEAAAEPLPPPLQRVLYSALCRLHHRTAAVSETLRWCERSARLLPAGEAGASPLELRRAAAAHVYAAWAHVETIEQLVRAVPPSQTHSHPLTH